MTFDEIVKERNSCRTYLPVAISDETIQKIVEAGRLAPSAKNKQPWKFVCVKTDFKNPNKSKKIASILSDYYIKNINNPEKMKGAGSVFATSKILADCPAIIFVFEDSEEIDRNSVESISDVLSIGACVEHMVLKATELGLGSLWICDTIYVHKEIAEYIQEELKNSGEEFVFDGDRLICAVAIGQRGEEKYARPRKALGDILLTINN